jgi:hypothetical protein
LEAFLQASVTKHFGHGQAITAPKRLQWRPMTSLAAELRPHPAHPCDAIRRLGVAIEPRSLPDMLQVRYLIEGDVGRLRLPPPGAAHRRDGLWHHSCFEAFLRPDASDSYHEFNFAPSGDWAAYRFGTRRAQRSLPSLSTPPTVQFSRLAESYELTADIRIGAMPELARAVAFHAALTAVVETTAGERSYWALAHGGSEPDFHDPATFLLRVAHP